MGRGSMEDHLRVKEAAQLQNTASTQDYSEARSLEKLEDTNIHKN